VEFLHTDALGSVRMVTDQMGEVVSRSDYYPFGSKIDALENGRQTVDEAYLDDPALRQRFTGKERDGESQLDYFGARYYSSAQGRFTSVDPAVRLMDRLPNPQLWNAYAYVLNRPLSLVDPTGQWPTFAIWKVHQPAIDRALGHLPRADRAILKDQQSYADRRMFQTNEYAHRHAMRGPHETAAEARERANDFVREWIGIAQAHEKEGNPKLALLSLGLAMHTVQDATSPAHEGFQLWDERWTLGTAEFAAHVDKEEEPTDEQEQRLDHATTLIWEYFMKRKPLPDDFFEF